MPDLLRLLRRLASHLTLLLPASWGWKEAYLHSLLSFTLTLSFLLALVTGLLVVIPWRRRLHLTLLVLFSSPALWPLALLLAYHPHLFALLGLLSLSPLLRPLTTSLHRRILS